MTGGRTPAAYSRRFQFAVSYCGARFPHMRSGFSVCTLVIAAGLLAVPSHALAQAAPRPAPTAEVRSEGPELTHDQKLDKLFGELKRERNEGAAKRIAGNIQQEWSNSGSASIDLMMGWAKTAMDKKKFDVALDFLDQVILLDPDYPEGWNRRATAHFMMQNFSKSMADINKTLQLEPRHFGAMAGLAIIMQARGNKELAMDAYTRILTVFPMDRNAQNQVSTIGEELAGESI